MTTEFVWFSLGAEDAGATRDFYSTLLDWEIAEEGMVAGGDRPWAAITRSEDGEPSGWVPYVEVEDVDQATQRAVELGASVLRERTAGQAGEFATIADPSGAPIALWQPATA